MKGNGLVCRHFRSFSCRKSGNPRIIKENPDIPADIVTEYSGMKVYSFTAT
jgi:hypothetical protein